MIPLYSEGWPQTVILLLLYPESQGSASTAVYCHSIFLLLLKCDAGCFLLTFSVRTAVVGMTEHVLQLHLCLNKYTIWSPLGNLHICAITLYFYKI